MGFIFSLNFNSKAALFHNVHMSNQNFNSFHAPLGVLWGGTAENTVKGSKNFFTSRFLPKTTLAAFSIQLPAASRSFNDHEPRHHTVTSRNAGNLCWLYLQHAVQVMKPQIFACLFIWVTSTTTKQLVTAEVNNTSSYLKQRDLHLQCFPHLQKGSVKRWLDTTGNNSLYKSI